MGIAMIAGSWTAKRVIERIPQKKFERYVAILLIGIAGVHDNSWVIVS
ncbi:MAG: hypothetical protein KBF68_11600 [Nitrosomonas sp.]|nr:hypothetical protein [Nitrosomonas sp.]